MNTVTCNRNQSLNRERTATDSVRIVAGQRIVRGIQHRVNTVEATEKQGASSANKAISIASLARSWHATGLGHAA
eukprot:6302517-Amphidinium_carterae.2